MILRQNRNYTLDIVKGICIILMVVGHSGTPKYIHDFVYMFHMPCFFIISGMLFKEKYLNDIKGFIIRKGKTLWKPFVVWTLIFLALHNILAYFNLYNDIYSFEDTVKYVIKGVLMRKTEPLLGGFWFLASLLFASLLSLTWYRLFGLSILSLSIGICVTLLLSFTFSHYSLNHFHISYLNFLATSYFMTGTLLSRIKIKHKAQKNVLILASMFMCAIATFYIPCNMMTAFSWLIIAYYIISAATSWSLILICTMVPYTGPTRWIITLGERTLDILIFHFLALKSISVIKILHFNLPWDKLSDFPVIKEHNDFYWILYSIAGIAFSVILADMVYGAKNWLTKKISA